MAVSRRLRFEILRRDNYTCRYCGASAPDVPLTIDHVIPFTLGGGDEPNNLVTACQDCNAGKSSVPADASTVEDVDATAFLWKQAIERVNEQRRAEFAERTDLIERFDNLWLSRCPWGPQGNFSGQTNDWPNRVSVFLEAGLSIDDLAHFVDAAFIAGGVENKNRWRYFLGCCWGELTRRQEMARRLIEDGEV